MKHFIDPKTNRVYAYESDGSQDAFIQEHLVPISEKDLAALRDTNSVKDSADLSYQQLRAREYPPITDYLDAVVKGDQVQMQTYVDTCNAVKAKYPKPTATTSSKKTAKSSK